MGRSESVASVISVVCFRLGQGRELRGSILWDAGVMVIEELREKWNPND